MTPDFWRGRSVFVTGHTGFKGTWLVFWLLRMGARVSGYSLPPEKEHSLFGSSGVAGRLESSTMADVRDLSALTRAVEEASPEIVIHMAAQSLVRTSYSSPVETFSTNLMGTVHLLESIRNCASVKSVVIVTTDKCYENKGWTWGYREIDRLGGHDPYSASKACAELATASYRASFFPEGSACIATARAGNVIGGGDDATDRLLPDIIRSLRHGKTIPIRNPSSIRPWQHVLEPLRGYLLLAETMSRTGRGGESWNFGPPDGQGVPVSEIAGLAVEAWGAGSWASVDNAGPAEMATLHVDSAKARTRLGWRCLLTTAQAVEWTIRWQRQVDRGQALQEVMDQQLDEYEALY